MLTAKPTDDLRQGGLDPESGDCCAGVGVAIGLVARIFSEPGGTAAPEPDRLAARWAAVTS